MKKWEYYHFYEECNLESKNREWSLYVWDKDEAKWLAHPTSEKWAIMNKLGQQGWELIGFNDYVASSSPRWESRVFFDTNQVNYYFKRELETQ